MSASQPKASRQLERGAMPVAEETITEATKTAWLDILQAYLVYNGEWVEATEKEKKAMIPHCLLYALWHGHFYAGKYQEKEYLPFILLVNHLAQINPAHVVTLLNFLQNPGSQNFQQGLFSTLDKIYKQISNDEKNFREYIATTYTQQFPRNYTDLINPDELNEHILNEDEKAIDNPIDQCKKDNANSAQNVILLKLKFDLEVAREKILARKNAFDASFSSLKMHIYRVTRKYPGLGDEDEKQEMSTSNPQPTDNGVIRQRANDIAATIATGEAVIAVAGAASTGVPPLVAFAGVGPAGFMANFYLARNEIISLFHELKCKEELTGTLPENCIPLHWLHHCLIGFNLNLYFDEEGKRLPWPKRILALLALGATLVVGGLFGSLSMGTFISLVTGLLGLSAAFPVTAPLLIFAILTAGLIAAQLFRIPIISEKKWLALPVLAGLVTSFMAPSLFFGIIVGLATAIATCSAFGLTAILFSHMVKLIKQEDTGNRLIKYLWDCFEHSAWDALTLLEKTGHVFLYCLPRFVGLVLTLSINIASLVGQFVLFSSSMTHLFGSVVFGCALAGVNAAVYIPFGFLSVEERIAAAFTFFKSLGQETFAKLQLVAAFRLSPLQSKSGRMGFFWKGTGVLAAIVNGMGQGDLYGMNFLKAAGSTAVPLAVALVVFLHLPVVIVAIGLSIGAFLSSAIPNTNAMIKTLGKDKVVPVPTSQETDQLLSKFGTKMSNNVQSGKSFSFGLFSRRRQTFWAHPRQRPTLSLVLN